MIPDDVKKNVKTSYLRNLQSEAYALELQIISLKAQLFPPEMDNAKEKELADLSFKLENAKRAIEAVDGV